MNKIIYYLPRVLSALLVLFFGIFILEGFAPAHIFLTLVILGIAVTAWRWPAVGGWLLILLGIFFGWFFHPLWPNGFIIGGFALFTGVLFLLPKRKL